MGETVKGRTFVVAAAALAAVALLHLASGDGPGFGALLRWIASWFGGTPPDKLDVAAFAAIRVPRLLVAAFGGASLAIAGAVMQATFRNPLASPDLAGTAAGAALGGAIAIVAGWVQSSIWVLPFASLAGALAVTFAVFALAGVHGRFSVAALLLAGIALNTFAGAVTSFIVQLHLDFYAASSSLQFWLMGGLDARTWEHAVITMVGCALFTLLVLPRLRDLDLLTLHDDTAHSLGVDPQRARRWFVWCACGLTATTVSNTGGIAFVGLVVPHVARLLVGPGHRALLPASAVLGALLLVGSDLVCRTMPPDTNLRLGVVTAFLGAPYFLWLLAKAQRAGVA